MTESRGLQDRFAALASKLLQIRWLVRAPIWLFRARLGFLAGSRLLLLEHVGRKSGARRYVILEVVDRPAPGKYTVASGFGERAQCLWTTSYAVDRQRLPRPASIIVDPDVPKVRDVSISAHLTGAYISHHKKAGYSGPRAARRGPETSTFHRNFAYVRLCANLT